MHYLNISLIITTYNWEKALDTVLASVIFQRYLPKEILIADDGSKHPTKLVINKWQDYLTNNKIYINLKHIWQEDNGFQAAKIRNKAASKASYDYLVFIDGDCIASKNFFLAHANLKEPGFFVSGQRILLTKEFSEKVYTNNISLQNYRLSDWILARQAKNINRFLPAISVPGNFWRKLFVKTSWRGVQTCNLGVFKQDFFSVNGFDESFTGWGYEDSDLIARLFKLGVKRKSGKLGCFVAHLWHKLESRSKEDLNYHKFLKTLESKNFVAKQGMNQYI